MKNKLLLLLLLPCAVLAETVTVTKTDNAIYVRKETSDGKVYEEVIEGQLMDNGSIRRVAFDNNTGMPYYYYIKPSPFAGADPTTLKVYCTERKCN